MVIDLPLDKIDTILRGLGELPAKQSYETILEIHKQVKPQLEPKKEADQQG